MRETKYLLRKKSGSRNHTKRNWLDYDRQDYKGNFKEENIEEKFAKREAMTTKDKNGIDTRLVKKWLYSKIGQDFDTIYAEFLTRIQTKYLETHKDCIYWYVLKPNELKIEDGIVYEKWSTKYVVYKSGFYIHPDTNILCRVVEAKKRTVSHKEGKTKFAEYKKQKNKSNREYKKIMENVSEQAVSVMKEKKANNGKETQDS